MIETPPNKEETEKNWVKPATEYGPLAVFLITYYGAGIYAATAALMGATAIALTFSFVINRRLPLMPIITAVIVGIFGALTLIFQDDTFIKVKPTIVYVLFASILITGLVLGKPLLKIVMGTAWPMTDRGWHLVTRRFSIFFIAMAIVNEFVWRTQTLEFWVNFKVWGGIGLTLIFALSLTPTLNRHKIKEPS